MATSSSAVGPVSLCCSVGSELLSTAGPGLLLDSKLSFLLLLHLGVGLGSALLAFTFFTSAVARLRACVCGGCIWQQLCNLPVSELLSYTAA